MLTSLIHCAELVLDIEINKNKQVITTLRFIESVNTVNTITIIIFLILGFYFRLMVLITRE
jgi:hypothetical protein